MIPDDVHSRWCQLLTAVGNGVCVSSLTIHRGRAQRSEVQGPGRTTVRLVSENADGRRAVSLVFAAIHDFSSCRSRPRAPPG